MNVQSISYPFLYIFIQLEDIDESLNISIRIHKTQKYTLDKTYKNSRLGKWSSNCALRVFSWLPLRLLKAKCGMCERVSYIHYLLTKREVCISEISDRRF